MPTELIIEDIIEQAVAFTKLNLSQIIFPHYDACYKSIAASSSEKSSNPKRKLLNQFSSNASGSAATNTAKTNKNTLHFYNKTREILSLFGDIVYQVNKKNFLNLNTNLQIACSRHTKKN